MDYSNNVFQVLKTMPKQGIYGLFDNKNKVAFISYSVNIPLAITKLLNDPKYSNNYFFNILDIVTTPENLRIRCQYFKDLYSNMGYNITNMHKQDSRKKVSIELLPDFRHASNGLCVFYVKLSNRGRWNVTVGVFDSYSDVQSFVAHNYSNGVNNIVYADNALTKEYLSEKK